MQQSDIQQTAPAKATWYRQHWPIIVVSGLGIAGMIALLAFVVFGVRPVRYSGSSMEPTLKDQDRILIRRPGTLKRGDIIAFRYPLDPTKYFVKRIVGLPDETIRIDESGTVIINGSTVAEPYVRSELNLYHRQVREIKIPSDAYFVMGDNRDASNDSRSWGTVPRSLVFGVMLQRY